VSGPGGRLPDDVLRELVRQAVARASLRRTAGEIGAWPSALRKFLNGSVPRESTRQKLHEWHTRVAGQAPHLSAETAGAALELLMDGLAARRRVQVRGRILSVLEAAHHDQQTGPPRWIAELRERRDGE